MARAPANRGSGSGARVRGAAFVGRVAGAGAMGMAFVVLAACMVLVLAGCGRRGSSSLSAEERARIPGIIAFVSERSSRKEVWLVQPGGEERRLVGSPEEDVFPAAPAPGVEALLVVASRQVDGVHREQLRLVDLANGVAAPLHAPRGRARNPSWAPSGSWFVAESDARGFSDLERMGVQPGDAPVPLATAPQGNFEPSVSPDGREIAFVSSRDGDPEIYVMAAAGEQAGLRRLTAFHKEDWAPVWSPDGQWIAFLSNREGRARVFVVRPDGTGTHPVSGSAVVGDERDIAWSPDGKHLAFVAANRDGTTRIYVAPVDGGAPVALTGGASRDDQPAWSPDGKYLVFVSEQSGDADLYLMRADGSGQTRLTQAPGADWLPRWLSARSRTD